MNSVREDNKDRPLTDAQRVKIFAAARELQLTDEELRAFVWNVAHKHSVRQLTRFEASVAIDLLVSEGASGPRRRARRRAPEARAADGPNVIRLASDEQRRVIVEVLADLRLSPDSPYFLGLVKRATGRSWFSTSTAAAKVIEALKSVRRRQRDDARPAP